MQGDIIIIIGVLLFVGAYLILSKLKREMVFGVVLFSNAINLLLLIMSGSSEGKSSPILDGTSSMPPVDPLPQALILTAIVIGFGMIALLIAIVYTTESGANNSK